MRNFKINSISNCKKAVAAILRGEEVRFWTSPNHFYIFDNRDLSQIINTYQSSRKWIGDGQCVVEISVAYADGRNNYKEFFFENGSRCSYEEMEECNAYSDSLIEAFWADAFSSQNLANSLSDLVESGMGPDTFDYEGYLVPFGALTDSYGRAI